MSPAISIVVMTKNEAARITACLETLRDFDDVFVVDSNSTDNTAAIAKNYGAHVVNFTWDGQYPKKKQWCFENLPFKYNWILYVDADEHLTPALTQELRALAPSPDMAGYYIAAKTVFLNRVLHFGLPNKKLALLKRGAAHMPQLDDLDVGEVEGTYQPIVTGTAGRVKNAMLHDCNDIEAWLTRHARYARRDALLRARKNGLKTAALNDSFSRRLKKQIMEHMPLRFLFVFFYCYVARLGFLDGSAGFHYAVARAFFYWQRDVRSETINRAGSHLI